MNTGKKLTNKEALERINQKCHEKNVNFIGFKNKNNEYENNKTKLILQCKKCGNVWETTSYDKFVIGNRNCPNCANNKKIDKNKVISKISEICEKRDFTFLEFVGEYCGVQTKLHLKCNKCGHDWKTTTYNNLKKSDRNSHNCNKKNPTLKKNKHVDSTQIINKLEKKLKNTFLKFLSFDENGYIGYAKTHVLLKCTKCNSVNKYSFKYVMSNNISCKSCEYNGKISNEKAIKNINEKCKILEYTFLGFKTNNNTYDGKDTRLILKCNKCGYTWDTTTYSRFIKQIIKCKECSNCWKMEKEIEHMLKKNSIRYIHDCRTKTLPWLKYKKSLSLDFYLPEYNIGIECQGKQHFEPVLNFGGEKGFKETVERDKRKLLFCKENNVKLLYYDSQHNNNLFLGEKVYNDEINLLKQIISYGQKN